MKKAILDMDATNLAERIKKGDISSAEATETYIEHLVNVNPQINAMVEERFEVALSEAKACDKLLQAGKAEGKLFGVPISVKEAISVKGMRTTGGLIHRKHATDHEDADVIVRLKAEGAVILGKTNTPTLCFCQETDNKLFGRTNNPWNVSRTAGGSSGGEGALIAVGGAAVGIGADIGGSLRFPAHFNGVIGFKSGNRQVPHKGLFPYVEHPDQLTMLGFGALAKSVNDAELINSIIATAPPPMQMHLERFKIIVPPVQMMYPLDTDTALLMDSVLGYFADRYPVDMEMPPLFEQSALLWQLIMSIDGGTDMAKHTFGASKASPLLEYAKEMLWGNTDTHRYMSWALIGAHLFKPSNNKLSWIQTSLRQAEKLIGAYFNRRILVLPVYHRSAPEHGKLYNEIFSFRKTFLKYMPYVAYANTMGLPSLMVPVGTDADGMPISVQIVGSVGSEQALFHFGRKLERDFRGYVRCAALDR